MDVVGDVSRFECVRDYPFSGFGENMNEASTDTQYQSVFLDFFWLIFIRWALTIFAESD